MQDGCVSIDGFYLDGVSSKQQLCTLEIIRTEQDLMYIIKRALHDNIQFLPNEVQPHDRTGTDFSLELGRAVFEPKDPKALQDANRQLKLKLYSSFLADQPLVMLVLVAIGAVFLFFYMLIFHIGPAASPYIVQLVPQNAIEATGESAMEQMDRVYFEESTLPLALQESLRSYFYEAYPQSKIETRVHFRASESLGANAFALPSGDVIFTDDLVRLARQNEELLAIFLHEWAHVQERHGLQQIIQNSIVVIGVYFVMGDMELLTDSVLDLIPAAMVSMKYSREFEISADLFAAQKLDEQGYSSESLITILERLEEEYKESDNDEGEDRDSPTFWTKVGEFLSSHPTTAERAAVIRALNDQL